MIHFVPKSNLTGIIFIFVYSRHTLSDTFLALKKCVIKGNCFTQGMSVRFRDIPRVTHVSQNSVTSGKFNTIFPEVTHFSAQTCVTLGKIALNLLDFKKVIKLMNRLRLH